MRSAGYRSARVVQQQFGDLARILPMWRVADSAHLHHVRARHVLLPSVGRLGLDYLVLGTEDDEQWDVRVGDALGVGALLDEVPGLGARLS